MSVIRRAIVIFVIAIAIVLAISADMTIDRDFSAAAQPSAIETIVTIVARSIRYLAICHADTSTSWATQAMRRWSGQSTWRLQ